MLKILGGKANVVILLFYKILKKILKHPCTEGIILVILLYIKKIFVSW